ncbi:peptidyl-prolyl cis-trans isomerase SurA [Methylomarinovum tepidoasis]|uniref:Chaperone SurA n=1 Tax=Methylomarinovum tepidoasis TaxID=2840183 RepID=A0AAU9C9Y3_9GAMM|nr:peptidylprolyl isomerase [Methylomarinovum sp. IN45]BCX88727.1 peptidyl-prolyl cis-trans isomerase SurA [Methylomarinovum sp. IN45]
MRYLPLFLLLLWTAVHAEPLDRIVAVAEDDVILESELERQTGAIARQLRTQGAPLPPPSILRRQVLERMILRSLQLQLARKAGIEVDDETLRQALLDLAHRNGMNLDAFRQAVESEGMDYAAFVDHLREELVLKRLRASQVDANVQVSEREITHFLETEAQSDPLQATEYRLGHILIATPEATSPEVIQKAREKAERLVAELRQGLDFHQAAITLSDGAQALKGGDLGWRKLDQIPTLFADLVPKMQKGEIAGPIRSPSGFHVIKLLDLKGGEKHLIIESHVRHILIKPNEIVDDAEARRRLNLIRQRIEAGEDFAALAQAYSDDTASAVKGGDLGWITADAVVPPFAEAMNRLKKGEISEPVQTPFGWHIIQVLERKQRDDTPEYRKKRAREILTRRKIEEETELWLRKLRDESYVEIHLD